VKGYRFEDRGRVWIWSGRASDIPEAVEVSDPGTAPGVLWATIPDAARLSGLSADSIRLFVLRGIVRSRQVAIDLRTKIVVFDDVLAVIEQRTVRCRPGTRGKAKYGLFRDPEQLIDLVRKGRCT
jgi:hypothetical protein